MKVCLTIATIAAAVAGIWVGTAQSGPSNQYETLRVRMLTPKLTQLRGPAYFRIGRLSITDPMQPTAFKFSVVNVGGYALTNVHVKFVPIALNPRTVVSNASPGARYGRGFLQWTIRSLGAHKQKTYSVSTTFPQVSAGNEVPPVVYATATPPPGINGLVIGQFEVIVGLRKPATTTATTQTTTSTTTTTP